MFGSICQLPPIGGGCEGIARAAALFHLTFTQPSVRLLAAASCRSETASERQ